MSFLENSLIYVGASVFDLVALCFPRSSGILFGYLITLVFTGPFKVNGVPLRRVNQSYVIGTSTKIDISGVNVDKYDDKYFKKEAKKKKKKTEGEFFETEKEVHSSLPSNQGLCLYLYLMAMDVSFSVLVFPPYVIRKRRHFHKRRKMTRRPWMPN